MEEEEHESLLGQPHEQQQQQQQFEGHYSNQGSVASSASALMVSDDENDSHHDEMESLITPLISVGHNDPPPTAATMITKQASVTPLVTAATATTATAQAAASKSNNSNNNNNSIFRSRKHQKSTVGNNSNDNRNNHHGRRRRKKSEASSTATSSSTATRNIPTPFAPLRKYLCNEGSIVMPPSASTYCYFCNSDRHKEVMKSTIAVMNVLAKVLFWSSLLFLAACVVWYSFELKHNGTDPHLIAWFSAGAFVLLGFPISMYGIVMHLANYNQPNVQCYIVRILWMVPIYSLESWLCLRFHRYAIYIETLRDCYEAYVLYNFLQFLIHTLGGEEDLMLLLKDKSPTRGVHMWGLQWCVKPWLMGQPVSRGFDFTKQKQQQQQLAAQQQQQLQLQLQQQRHGQTLPLQQQLPPQGALPPPSIRPIKRVQWTSPFFKKCKLGVLQYVLLKVILSIAVMILELHGIYKEGDFTPKGGYLYICILTNLSQCWALYCLIFFYFATKNELSPIRPVGKFLSVKALVFFTWWQSVTISMLYQADMIPHYKDRDAENEWTSEDVAKGLQDYLICIEMFVGAIVHTFVFPHTEYLEAAVMARSKTTTLGGSTGALGRGDNGTRGSPLFNKKRIGRNIMKHRNHYHHYYNNRRKGGERTPWSRDDASFTSKNSAISSNYNNNNGIYDLEMAMTTSMGGESQSLQQQQQQELGSIDDSQLSTQHEPLEIEQTSFLLKTNSNLSSVEEGSRKSNIARATSNDDGEQQQEGLRYNNNKNNEHYHGDDGIRNQNGYYENDEEEEDDDDDGDYYDNDEDLSSLESDHNVPIGPTTSTQKTGFVRALLDSTIPRDVMDNTVGIVKGDYHVEKKTLLHHAATSDQYDLFSLSSKRRAFSKLAAAAAQAQSVQQQTTSMPTTTGPTTSDSTLPPTTTSATNNDSSTATDAKRN